LHADDDKKKKEIIETRNRADSLVYTAEKALNDSGDKVPQEVKTEIQTSIDSLKKVKDGDDLTAIKNAEENLSKTVQKIGEAMYKNAPSDAPEVGKDHKDNVKDADYKDIDTEKQ
jgi:molecular chaperone DnaK